MAAEDARVDFHGATVFADLPFLRDPALIELVQACVTQQREAADATLESFVPHPDAKHEVSQERLEELLAAGRDVHGMAEDRGISNVLVFNTERYADTLQSEQAAVARERVDAWVRARLQDMFRGETDLRCANSGFFLYPPGSYMGWHTNSKVPGWRLMLSWVDEPQRSFFRYRDPTSGEVVTDWDAKFNVRLNNLSAEHPVWHAVYSETNRYSMIFLITTRKLAPSLPRRALRKLKRFLK